MFSRTIGENMIDSSDCIDRALVLFHFPQELPGTNLGFEGDSKNSFLDAPVFLKPGAHLAFGLMFCRNVHFHGILL